MAFRDLEMKIHDMLLNNPQLRKLISKIYSRITYMILPKINSEGDIIKLSPDDGYEYFFGYYDKCPWNINERFILSLRTKGANLFPAPGYKAEIILIDTQNNNSVKIITETSSWNSQQGCMVQWLDEHRIIYNDFRDNRYCSVILNIETNEEQIVAMPVYSVSSDGQYALTLDFSRLHRLRPGYGYSNLSDKSNHINCPDDACIWSVDLNDGEIKPLLKYTDFNKFEHRPEMDNAEHKVNHIMISPSGNRFMVIHRWIIGGKTYSRLITCNADGSDMYNLSDDDFVSHCNWKNNNQIISFLKKKNGGKAYYILDDKSQEYQQIWQELSNIDGHPSYSPDCNLIVTDSYPDRQMLRSLYINTEQNVNRVARVFSTFKYAGNMRCDLHPRWNRSGDTVCFDACFENLRGLYTIKAK